MNVAGSARRSIATSGDRVVEIIDQTELPARLVMRRLQSLDHVVDAICAMRVRGAPLIGVTAAYGVALAMHRDSSDTSLESAIASLLATRPTAVNLAWALDSMRRLLTPMEKDLRAGAAWQEAGRIAEEDVATCKSIADHGCRLLSSVIGHRSSPLRIMTHCNAGWLATVDWGTALAPVYALHDSGVPVHVWVSETRPRNQGLLTAWELAQHGVPHTVVVDSAAGHLIQRGDVDAVIVGTDRTARNGDVVNKVGTVLKALAAHDAGVPFFVAAPSSSIDFAAPTGTAVKIEYRSGTELGAEPDVPVINPGFDVTPARLVSSIVTERGVCRAAPDALAALFPERVA